LAEVAHNPHTNGTKIKLGVGHYTTPDLAQGYLQGQFLAAVANEYPEFLGSLRADVLPVFERWLRERARLNPFRQHQRTISGVCNITAQGYQQDWAAPSLRSVHDDLLDAASTAFIGWARRWNLANGGEVPEAIERALCQTMSQWVRGADPDDLHIILDWDETFPSDYRRITIQVDWDPTGPTSVKQVLSQIEKDARRQIAAVRECATAPFIPTEAVTPEHLRWLARRVAGREPYDAIAKAKGLHVESETVRNVVTALRRDIGLTVRRSRPSKKTPQ
jgi:hypothetical protein